MHVFLLLLMDRLQPAPACARPRLGELPSDGERFSLDDPFAETCAGPGQIEGDSSS